MSHNGMRGCLQSGFGTELLRTYTQREPIDCECPVCLGTEPAPLPDIPDEIPF